MNIASLIIESLCGAITWAIVIFCLVQLGKALGIVAFSIKSKSYHLPPNSIRISRRPR
jgi:hypothetical protein